jgi:hypothetical protein
MLRSEEKNSPIYKMILGVKENSVPPQLAIPGKE